MLKRACDVDGWWIKCQSVAWWHGSIARHRVRARVCTYGCVCMLHLHVHVCARVCVCALELRLQFEFIHSKLIHRHLRWRGACNMLDTIPAALGRNSGTP